jgi:uncharacterized protein YheU (UPF0270 family)
MAGLHNLNPEKVIRVVEGTKNGDRKNPLEQEIDRDL